MNRRPLRSPIDAAAAAPRFHMPKGIRAYAVGDIHGQVGLLKTLQRQIDADVAERAPAKTVEIYLGDYIDRGPDSAGVIETLSSPRPHRTIFLRGNHEDYPERFLRGDDATLRFWLRHGGAATLASYGVNPSLTASPASLRHAFRKAVPERHLTFLRELNLAYRLGEIFFVHAGIRPGVPLDRQAREDLISIRREFIDGDPALPVRVVHGHTPHRQPQLTPHRVGVDTGAFATGRLTCAVLEDDTVRFLST